mgnify:CR=1 FL=1
MSDQVLASILLEKAHQIDNILEEVEDLLRNSPPWNQHEAQADTLPNLIRASNGLSTLAELLTEESPNA